MVIIFIIAVVVHVSVIIYIHEQCIIGVLLLLLEFSHNIVAKMSMLLMQIQSFVQEKCLFQRGGKSQGQPPPK